MSAVAKRRVASLRSRASPKVRAMVEWSSAFCELRFRGKPVTGARAAGMKSLWGDSIYAGSSNNAMLGDNSWYRPGDGPAPWRVFGEVLDRVVIVNAVMDDFGNLVQVRD